MVCDEKSIVSSVNALHHPHPTLPLKGRALTAGYQPRFNKDFRSMIAAFARET
jgi:hypothetical protein